MGWDAARVLIAWKVDAAADRVTRMAISGDRYDTESLAALRAWPNPAIQRVAREVLLNPQSNIEERQRALPFFQGATKADLDTLLTAIKKDPQLSATVGALLGTLAASGNTAAEQALIPALRDANAQAGTLAGLARAFAVASDPPRPGEAVVAALEGAAKSRDGALCAPAVAALLALWDPGTLAAASHALVRLDANALSSCVEIALLGNRDDASTGVLLLAQAPSLSDADFTSCRSWLERHHCLTAEQLERLARSRGAPGVEAAQPEEHKAEGLIITIDLPPIVLCQKRPFTATVTLSNHTHSPVPTALAEHGFLRFSDYGTRSATIAWRDADHNGAIAPMGAAHGTMTVPDTDLFSASALISSAVLSMPWASSDVALKGDHASAPKTVLMLTPPLQAYLEKTY